MKKCKMQFIIVLLTFLFLTNFCLAEDLYVSPSGDGTNPSGVWESGWPSFTAIEWGDGINKVSAGDTLYIDGGSFGITYTSILIIGASGTVGSPITIKPGQDSGHNGVVTITNSSGSGMSFDGNDYVTIDGEYNGTRHIRFYKNSNRGVYDLGNYCKVLYCTIDENGDANGDQGVEIRGKADNWEIAYCLIEKNYECAIYQGDPADSSGYGHNKIHHNQLINIGYDGIKNATINTDIYNNIISTFYNTGRFDPHLDGIQAPNYFNHYTRIYNNIIEALDNSAVYVSKYSTGGTVQYIEIYNNVIVGLNQADAAYSITFQVNTGISVTYQNILIANNTIYDWDFPGIRVFGAGIITIGSHFKVVNNIISNCSQTHQSGGILLKGTWTDKPSCLVDYNIIHAGAKGDQYITIEGIKYTEFGAAWDATYPDWSNNLNSDPSLDSNYRVDNESAPVVDAGIELSAVFTTDKDGNIRPQGAGWDMGAFELLLPPEPPKNLRIVNTQ